MLVDGETIVAELAKRFPGALVSSGSYRNQHWAYVAPGQLVEVCRWLKYDPAASFDFLTDVTAAHWPDHAEPMEVVYHLYSLSRNDRIRLKVRTGDVGPVPSLSMLWASANWNEREAFDMFGIVFEGHPDLRRILMPDEYTDYPLRKEFPLFRG